MFPGHAVYANLLTPSPSASEITMPVVLSNRNAYDGVVQYDQDGAIKIRNHLTIYQEISWRFEWENHL